MAYRFASILSANYLSLTTSPSLPIVNSLHQFSNKLSKRVGLFNHNKRPRRVVLGLGVTFWAQFLNMAGNFGGKSFLASARQKSEVDKVFFWLNFGVLGVFWCFSLWVVLKFEFWWWVGVKLGKQGVDDWKCLLGFGELC